MDWIPIRKTEPEKYQRILITIWARNRHRVRSATYLGDGLVSSDTGETWRIGERGLTAWQPAPEPYQSRKGK